MNDDDKEKKGGKSSLRSQLFLRRRRHHHPRNRVKVVTILLFTASLFRHLRTYIRRPRRLQYILCVSRKKSEETRETIISLLTTT